MWSLNDYFFSCVGRQIDLLRSLYSITNLALLFDIFPICLHGQQMLAPHISLGFICILLFVLNYWCETMNQETGKKGSTDNLFFINSDEAVPTSHWIGFSLAAFWFKVIGRFFSMSWLFLAKTSLLWFKLVNIKGENNIYKKKKNLGNACLLNVLVWSSWMNSNALLGDHMYL